MTSRLGDFMVDYENSQEYHSLKQEIFTKDNYFVEMESDRPVIIDAGAHIGLATLYFKKFYPNARVIAIEPNPEVIPLLEKNIAQNFLTDVTIIPSALSSKSADSLNLYRDRTPEKWWSVSGINPGAWTGDQKSETYRVSTVSLDEVCVPFDQVDLLKMDIEGMEQLVLSNSHATLAKIKHLFVEFHPTSDQNLGRLMEFLKPYFLLEIFQKGKVVTLDKARGLVLIEGHQPD